MSLLNGIRWILLLPLSVAGYFTGAFLTDVLFLFSFSRKVSFDSELYANSELYTYGMFLAMAATPAAIGALCFMGVGGFLMKDEQNTEKIVAFCLGIWSVVIIFLGKISIFTFAVVLGIMAGGYIGYKAIFEEKRKNIKTEL